MTKEMAINILRGDVLGTNEQTHEAVFMAIKALKEQAQVDAVEVVRCKDCESWGLNAIKKDEKGEVIYGDCLHFCYSTPKWFYCAWGVRKNGQ